MKSVLVTGASRGIGRAICAEALRRGYRVHALVRTPESAPPGTTPHLAPDIRDRAAVEKAIVALAPELTHFIANAGVAGNYNPRDPRAAEKLVETFDINATATAYSMAVIAREWVKLGLRGRRLAVTSSLAAGRGMATTGPYCATKTAELCLAEAMECDLAPLGIGVSVIRPGFVRTDLTEDNGYMPFLMDADRAARIVWNGLERGRFEIAFPWPMTWLCWVRDRVPYFLYRMVNRRIAGSRD